MPLADFWMKKDEISMSRSLRLAVIRNQFDIGNLSEMKAKKLLAGPLSPGDDSTIFDDSDCLRAKIPDA